MPSPFDALMAANDAAVMDAFGETEAAILRPRLASQYAARALDPARPECEVAGVFSAAAPADMRIRGNAEGEYAGTTRLASTAPEFWISPDNVALIPYVVAVGDLILFPCRSGSPVYAVARIQRTDIGDLNLILVSEDETAE